MTLYQFNALEDEIKPQTLWKNAVVIGERFEGECHIVLYQFFDFYVELFHLGNSKEIQRVRSFDSTNPLEVYLKNIDLSFLK